MFIDSFTVKVNDMLHKIEPSKIIQLDQNKLNESIVELPGHYAWIASLRSLAYRSRLDKNNGYKVWRAKMYNKIAEGYDKKPTEKQIESEIRESPKYTKYKDAITKAEFEFERLDSLLIALKIKKDLIQTLSSNIRAEYEHGTK